MKRSFRSRPNRVHRSTMACLLKGLLLATVVTSSSTVLAQPNPMPMCPIMTDNPASTEHYADYEGKRYYFCCAGCVNDFQSDPSRFVNMSTVVGVPIESLGENNATASADGDSDGATDDGMLANTMIYLQQKMDKRVDEYCLDMPLVQFHLLAFFAVLCVPCAPRFRKSKRARTVVNAERLGNFKTSLGRKLAFFGSKLQLRWLVWWIVVAMSFDATCMASRSSNRERKLLRVLAGDDSLTSSSDESAVLDRDELELIQEVHYSTFVDYGFPPRPRKREEDIALERTYYRGNDERHPQMHYGGQYRTVTFHVSLETQDGQTIEHRDPIAGEPVFVKVQFVRAPFTSSGYYTREHMKRMYLTMQADRFLGRDEPVKDRTSWIEVEEGRVWEARFELPPGDQFPADWQASEPGKGIDEHRRGIVYLCEERMDENQQVLGGRFHFAVEYSLEFAGGELTSNSDVFMGTNYRGHNFKKYDITEREWLSTEPIPEKTGP